MFADEIISGEVRGVLISRLRSNAAM